MSRPSVSDEAYEPMPEGRPVDDPTLRRRLVDEAAHEPTPRERPVDNPNLREGRSMIRSQDR